MPETSEDSSTLSEIAKTFFKLGATAFGGPAAHISMMEEELVERRQWVSREHFLDLVGATNLVPGPNSTEVAMHLGHERGGFLGLLIAGISFIFPAAFITSLFAWAYVSYGSLPNVESVLLGVKPAVLAVILGACIRLGKSALKDIERLFLGGLAFAALLYGFGEIPVLLCGGVLGMIFLRAPKLLGLRAVEPLSLTLLVMFFLKVGAVLYGSGYVLVAFLEGELVNEKGWLTQGQLLDAVAIGQLTPGPVLTTATAIGYLLLGPVGATAATLAIFFPSFVFVLMLNPLIPKMRQSLWLSALLDAINAIAVAMMLAVTIELGVSVLQGWKPWAIALISVVLSMKFRVGAIWLIFFGGAAGFLML